MANHGFVTTRRKVTGDLLFKLLQEISQERFRGDVKIIRDSKDWMSVETIPDNVLGARQFWVETPHQIEHRHGPGGMFCWWIETCFANDLALKLNGTISDEGVEDRWKGEKNKYPSYRNYLEKSLAHKRSGFLERMIANVHVWAELREARAWRPNIIDIIDGKSRKGPEPSVEEVESACREHGFFGHWKFAQESMTWHDCSPDDRKAEPDVERLLNEYDWQLKTRTWKKKDKKDPLNRTKWG